jgi:hypothetical protein
MGRLIGLGRTGMMRRSAKFRTVIFRAVLAIGATTMPWAVPAIADPIELPARKPGLWEMKMLASSGAPGMTMQHCTDETTDKFMNTTFSPMAKDMCSKNEMTKTATGYATDSVCNIGGVANTSHADITGDFNSAYKMKVTSHSDGVKGAARDATIELEAKWLGACKPDQRPGDIMMPGGMKMNVKDLEKMKATRPEK